ncbi:hypothetical protein QYE76_033911 [Lolium multiflorum]|uniref:Uncharacterized protein n=1 Tax=Lolium multiflorum TaxID=4521 RepID=A0AAD8QWC6_LOLMU|nr:hypothetical protein QYE76_033911 [Lolium multiflorum]
MFTCLPCRKLIEAIQHLPDQVYVRWHALANARTRARALRAVARGTRAHQQSGSLRLYVLSLLAGGFWQATHSGTPGGTLYNNGTVSPSRTQLCAKKSIAWWLILCTVSESLLNSLERITVRVVQEIMKHQYSPSGPALGTHQGEVPLYTRPPLPFALAAPGFTGIRRLQASDQLHVRFFSQSLTGPAFGWYTSLPPDSVRTWKQLDEKFHVQYHSEATEAGIADRAGPVHHHGGDIGHSRGKDKEEAGPRDRPRYDDKRYITEEQGLSIPERKAESSQGEDLEESDDEEEDRYHRPRWCPDGLSHSQKRRVQRLHSLEEAEAQYLYTLRKARPDLAVKIQQTLEAETRPQKKEWRPKQAKADAKASAGTNMVFILPSKFCAPRIEEVPVAQLDCGPRPVIFEKPQERSYKHLKALYLRGYINGQPVGKMLVDTGAAVNIMPYSMLRRLGLSTGDLIKTNVTLSDFNGQALEARGILNMDLTVGRKTIPTSFFIVDSKSTYAVLLGRDWIHTNCCIPSNAPMLIQWDGDEVEVVHADDSIRSQQLT